jgi:hypothetical protein
VVGNYHIFAKLAQANAKAAIRLKTPDNQHHIKTQKHMKLKLPHKERLTEEDIKTLKYQCRMGIILPTTVTFMLILLLFVVNYADEAVFPLSHFLTRSAIISGFGVFISYLINRNYISDLRNDEKNVETKNIQLKEIAKDFEAGSGTLYIGQEMNEFNRYNLIIENTRYRVDKVFFENCEIGDEVLFYTAPRSGFRLGIAHSLHRNVITRF